MQAERGRHSFCVTQGYHDLHEGKGERQDMFQVRPPIRYSTRAFLLALLPVPKSSLFMLNPNLAQIWALPSYHRTTPTV